MSAERRYNSRRFRLEESTTLNNGARTVFVEHMSPGTAVPPHWHDHFSETFDLISGTMQVYHTTEASVEAVEAAAQTLRVGTRVTVDPGRYHKYVVGDEPTVLRAIVTPGYPDFERLLMILNGMADDAVAAAAAAAAGGSELEKMGDSLVMMAVVMDLADAHLIGESGEQLEAVRKDKAAEIQALKKSLLAKYDTPEQLRKLME